MELCVEIGEQEELMAGRYLWSRLLSTGLGSGRESFCGGHGSDQVQEGTVIITSKNIVVKAICLCCSSSHWVQRDPATHRWQRKQLPRHWRMQASPMMPLKLLYVQLSHRDSVYNLCRVPG